MVCSDGSEASNIAIENIKHGLLRETDELVIAHAWQLEKEEYLKYNLKRDYIREHAEADFTYMGNRFHYHEQEIRPEQGDTAKSCLNAMAKEVSADVTVVGYHGRKGPKEDPTVMGSAVQYMSVRSESPVLIIKDPKSRE